jgi:hypothetical protein
MTADQRAAELSSWLVVTPVWWGGGSQCQTCVWLLMILISWIMQCVPSRDLELRRVTASIQLHKQQSPLTVAAL